MSSQNAYIENFLDYFCGLPHSPEYAVMLKGPWGCGKTWFINQYCEKLAEKGGKYHYISLYGIGSFAEIDNAFFEQLHPVLSSKGMALAGKILKGLLKTTLKIDLTNERHSGASMTSQLPDFTMADLSNYLKDTSSHILIFEDLERCRINTNDVLGYINHFVEHHGHKAIIIANEDEIIERENNDNEVSINYIRIKEKLVGKTFQIAPDINDSLNDFISKISDKKNKKFMNKNRALIIEIYEDSKYENLRQLKQSLWDFDRLLAEMPAKAWKKELLLQHILKLFLSYSFEIKSGAMMPNEISQIQSTRFTDYALKQEHRDGEISKFDKIRAKYSSVMGYDTIFNVNCWQDIFVKGVIDRKSLEQSILKSSYFQDEHTPNWVKLWHFIDLSDDEYDKILAKVTDKYYDNKYEQVGVIKHITGILLILSDEVKLYNKPKDKILGFAKNYIDYLNDHDKLSLEPESGVHSLDQTSWGGLEFWGKNLPEFKEFIDYVDKKRSEARVDKMPNAGKELLNIMESDPPLFARMITFSDSSDQKYYDIPIVKHIDPMDFVELFLKLNPANKRIIAYAIKKRYQFHDINKSLLEECDWWKSIHPLFSKKAIQLRGKISGYALRSLIIDPIEKIISTLEETSSEE